MLEGLPLLAELVRRAGDRIVIMPGGGITARNVERIVAEAQPKEIHFAALEPTTSGMRNRREHVFMGGTLRPPEYDRLVTSAASIRAVMAGGKDSQAVPILMYHRIADDGPASLVRWRVPEPDFVRQIAWLAAEGYTSIRLDDWLDRPAARPGVPLPGASC